MGSTPAHGVPACPACPPVFDTYDTYLCTRPGAHAHLQAIQQAALRAQVGQPRLQLLDFHQPLLHRRIPGPAVPGPAAGPDISGGTLRGVRCTLRSGAVAGAIASTGAGACACFGKDLWELGTQALQGRLELHRATCSKGTKAE